MKTKKETKKTMSGAATVLPIMGAVGRVVWR